MKNRQRQKDILFSILIFCSAFAINLLIQKLFTTQTLVPMIFVFGVFFDLTEQLTGIAMASPLPSSACLR